jgi:hypothetical protein
MVRKRGVGHMVRNLAPTVSVACAGLGHGALRVTPVRLSEGNLYLTCARALASCLAANQYSYPSKASAPEAARGLFTRRSFYLNECRCP